MRLALSVLLLSGGCLMGCQKVKRIGHLSERPILRITVGTTIELRWPEVTYEEEEEAPEVPEVPTG